MRKSSFVAAICGLFAAALAVAFVTTSALADNVVQGYQIDTTPLIQLLLPYLEPLVYVAIMGALGVVSRLMQKFVGVSLDDKHRRTLAEIGASKLSQFSYQQALQRAPVFHTKSEILRMVTSYIQERGPDAVKHFNLTPEDLQNYIMGHFGQQVIDLAGDSNGKGNTNLTPEWRGQNPADAADGLGAGPNATPAG
jgi:hypothetical protein